MPIISGGGGGGSGGSSSTVKKVTAKTVSGTVAETDLFNGEVTIPAGAMVANSIAVVDMWGDWVQHSGGATTGPILRFKFGATTLFAIPTFTSMLSVADSATRYSWAFRVTINNVNATNSQTAAMSGFMSCLSSSATTGVSNVVTTGTGTQGAVNLQNTAAIEHVCVYNVSAISTVSAVALAFTTVNASSSAAYDVTLHGALVAIF